MHLVGKPATYYFYVKNVDLINMYLHFAKKPINHVNVNENIRKKFPINAS